MVAFSSCCQEQKDEDRRGRLRRKNNQFALGKLDKRRQFGRQKYGYRYLDSVHGRWLNRDPIGEEGGINLYAIANNDPINNIDILNGKNVNVNRSFFGVGIVGRKRENMYTTVTSILMASLWGKEDRRGEGYGWGH